jgi:class 3 adenylate cyclase/tetratricopeptide (TPR) repeat protein
MIACPSCATELPEASRFCLSCGARLAAPAAAAEERKTVTTLFCDLVAFTAMSEAADPEDVDAVLRHYHAAARKVIESHGGTVEKFIGDAVVGVFGVPAAHEDDPERAVRAGLRIVQVLEGMTRPDGSALQVRVGVNTGEALVRLDVTPGSGEGFLTGDAVNTAARLQAAAPAGGVVVGALTHELTQRVIEYEELAPVAAKGKSAPVLAWLARAAVSRMGIDVDRSALSPLVGREVELDSLRALLTRVITTSSPQFAVLVGEPGIGKTRLVQELFAHVDARPELITWRQSRCPSFGESISFWALADIVKAHAGILDTDDAPTVADKLAAAVPVGTDHAWMVNRLRALVGLDAPLAEREENFTAWLRFLEHLAHDGPLVIVFEDLHWADEGLLAFVEYLADHIASVPLFIVGTARPELFEAQPSFAADRSKLTRISLGPLAPRETERLVAGVLGDAEAFSQRVADIVARSEGNPFFAEESARLLGDGTRDTPVPASVQAVVAARLDALPPEQKAVMADAAVMGEVFWDGALAELGHRKRDVVDAALRELAGKRLVRRARESSMAGESEFAFAHALARDVAYGALPRRIRAEKHAQAAAWLEAKAGERLEDVSDLLAHHRVTALDLARAVGDADLAERARGPAVTALMRAGERSMRLDVEAAERLFARAAELSTDGDAVKADLLQAWGRSLLQRGRHDEATAALEQSVDCFLGDGRKAEAAIALTQLEKASFYLGGTEWSAVLERALTLTDEEPDGEARARVMTAIGAGAIARGDYAAGLDWVQRAVDIYARRGMEVPLDLQGWQADAECGLGDSTAGIRLLRMARAMRDAGMGREASVAYVNAGVLLYPYEGPRAYEIAEEGLEFMRSRGISTGQGLMAVNRCYGLFSGGRWDEALSSLEALREWLEEGDDQFALFFWWQNRAAILAAMGRGTEAFECATEALERAPSWDDPVIVKQARTTMLLALTLMGDSRRASELLREHVTDDRDAGYQGDEESFPDLVRCAVVLGEVEVAEQLVRRLQPGLPLVDHVLVTCRALLAEASGEHEAAAAGFADAAARWRDFGVPYEEGHALFGQGRCLSALGRAPEAAAPLAAAREIFARLGAGPALAETDAALAGLREWSGGAA